MGTLFFVGLGLFDVRDLSLKGFEVISNAEKVFAEFYTSDLQGSSLKEIQQVIQREVRILSREEVEEEHILLEAAMQGDTVLLTGGDPLSATTHAALLLAAMRKGIPIRVIHSSSIFTAVPGLLGLHIYKFGRSTTIAKPEKDFFPTSPYDVIRNNLKLGLHTLVLLDIKQDEDYYMSGSEGLSLLMEMEKIVGNGCLTATTEVAVVARAGSENPLIWVGTLEQGTKKDFGLPLHSIVVPGDCHFMEREMLELFKEHGRK